MTDFTTLNQEFEKASPTEILRHAAETYGDKLAVVTSFQPTGIVTLHMLRDIAPRTTVLTLDTGLLFPETYELMDKVERDFGLNLVRVRPELTVEGQAEKYGDALWSREPDACCNMRKTMPLDKALVGFDAWITGLRRDQAAGRKETPIVSWDKKYAKAKYSPLATWTEEMVWTWINEYELPYNALHDRNYFSIGCWPCTRAVAEGEDKRAGRWSGTDKVECGIHVANVEEKSA